MFLILGTFCTTGIAKKKKMHVHYSKNQAIQTNTKMMGGEGYYPTTYYPNFNIW